MCQSLKFDILQFQWLANLKQRLHLVFRCEQILKYILILLHIDFLPFDLDTSDFSVDSLED